MHGGGRDVVAGSWDAEAVIACVPDTTTRVIPSGCEESTAAGGALECMRELAVVMSSSVGRSDGIFGRRFLAGRSE